MTMAVLRRSKSVAQWELYTPGAHHLVVIYTLNKIESHSNVLQHLGTSFRLSLPLLSDVVPTRLIALVVALVEALARAFTSVIFAVAFAVAFTIGLSFVIALLLMLIFTLSSIPVATSASTLLVINFEPS